MRKSITKIKNLIKKVLAAFITTVLCTNGYFGVICSEVMANFQDEDKPEVLSSIVLEKYCNYELGSDKGTLVQLNVQTGIEYKEGTDYKPIKNTQITLNSPVIEGEYPYSAVVIANSTKATNGKGFVSDVNYSYDAQTGTLQIFTENQEDENGNMYAEMDKNARDSYDVMYYYSSNVYNAEQKARQIQLTGNVSEEVADNDGTVIEKEINEEKEVSENISNVVSTNVWTSDIYNGYIYSNINNGTSLETEYTEYTNVNVSYKEIADEIVINQNSNFVNTKDEDAEMHDVVYKGIKLNKQQIENILGEDFVIEVIDNEGQTITQINKDTETNENNIIEVNYEKEYTNVNFKFSKPVKQGYLGIVSKKAIKAEMTQIENNRIKLQQNIISQNNIEEKDETTGDVKKQYKKEVNNYNVETIEEIKDSESKIEVTCDKKEITNETKNDVNFTAVLKTNDVKYNLFKNPEIEIEMPSEVDNVILGDVSLLYEDELKIKNSEVQDRNGVKFIKIELEGTQTEYSNSAIFDGANIVIPATIIVNKDIYSTESSIKVRYSNETGIKTSYENEGKNCEEIQLNIASMNVPVSEDTNQNVDITAIDGVQANLGESYVSLDDLEINLKAKVGDTELKDNNIVYEKEVIKYTVEIKNTSDKSMTNFNIKTLVPEGTTYIEKDGAANVGETANDEKTRNDLEIRYENKKEIEKTIQEIKSNQTWGMDYYVIVDDLEGANQKTIENKLFINDTETENINVVAEKGQMKVDIYPADKEYGKYQNMYIYEVRINNTSDQKITNVKATSVLSEEMELDFILGHVSEQYDNNTHKLSINIGDIEAHESKTIFIRMSAINFKEGVSECTIPFDLSASGDNTDTYRGDTQYVKAYVPDISVKMESPTEGQKLKQEDAVEYNVTIKNNGAVGTYINVIDNLPKEITAISATYERFESSEDNQYKKVQEEKDLRRKITTEGETSYDFELNTFLPKDESILIKIIGEVNNVSEQTEVNNEITVYGNDIGTRKSNAINNIIMPFRYEIYEQGDDSDEKDYSSEDEDFDDETYERDSFDDDDETTTLDYDEYIDDEDSENNNGNNNDNDNEDNNGENNEGNNQNNDGNNNENKDEEKQEETFKISGIAWKDDNKDGIRGDNEEKLKGIKVKLFNAETSSIVVDENNNKKETTTNENGEYIFENVSKGKYLIIFEYDTNTYTTTKYQVSSASSSENSDAIVKEIAIDGETKTVGVTDSITVKSSDIENIDIGLIESQIFDLKLDKYISKIVVKNSDGTKEYNYNNSQLAKIEIASKKMAESTVVIEYKIVVTNEGEISGKVDEIVDYIPEGLTFSSELNKDWYKGTDGKLRNSTLSQEELKAGESKTLVLTLTKAMTENSTGIVTNAAEITKATNANYVNDKDSTPGNNEQKEDDYSKAQVIISIKTGAIQYAMIIFAIIAIIFTIGLIIKSANIKLSAKISMIIMVMLFSGMYYSFRNVTNAMKEGSPYTENGQTYALLNYYDLFIEKVNGIWQKNANFNGNPEYNFVCITPGGSICGSEWHKYWKASTTACYSIDDVKNTTNIDDDNLYAKLKEEGIFDRDSAFNVEGNGLNWPEITKNNTGSEVKVVKEDHGDNNYLYGPFEYSLNTDVETIEVYVRNNSDDEYKKVNNEQIVNNSRTKKELIKSEGDHNFYLLLNKDTYENPQVKLYVKNSAKITTHFVNVEIWRPTSSCKKGGNAQVFARFLPASKTETPEAPHEVYWNVRDYTAIEIYKTGNPSGNALKGAKFAVTVYEDDSKKKEIFTAKDLTTSSSGKIKLDIPTGYVVVEETSTPDGKKYPYVVKDIKGRNILKDKNDNKTFNVSNDEYYYFAIEKIDADSGAKLNGAKIKVSELQGTETNGEWSYTSFGKVEEVTTESSNKQYVTGKIKVSETGSRIYKIWEDAAPNNYYNYNNPIRIITYTPRGANVPSFYLAKSRQNGKYVIGDDNEKEEITENSWTYVYDDCGNKVARLRLNGYCIRVQMINPPIVKVRLEKVSADNYKEKINGAKFKISYKTTNGRYYIKSYQWTGNDDSENNAVQAKIEWTTYADKALVFITGKNYLTGKNIPDKNPGNDGYDGKIILKGLPSGVYYAEEIEPASGYEAKAIKARCDAFDISGINSFYVNIKKTVNGKDVTKKSAYYVTETDNNNKTIKKVCYVVPNKKLVKVKLIKVDAKDKTIRLGRAGFVIYYKYKTSSGNVKNRYIKEYQWTGDDKTINNTLKATIEWTWKESEAKVFKTGDNYINTAKDISGCIILKGLEKNIYYAKETETPGDNYVNINRIAKVKAYDNKKMNMFYVSDDYGNIIYGYNEENKENEPVIPNTKDVVRVQLSKRDNDDKDTPLNGAGFKIYRIEKVGNNKVRKYIKTYQCNDFYDTQNVTPATITWTEDESEAIEFITGKNYLRLKNDNNYNIVTKDTKEEDLYNYDDKELDWNWQLNGNIELKGLPAGFYYAKETKAAPGYKLLDRTAKVNAIDPDNMNYFYYNVKGEKVRNGNNDLVVPNTKDSNVVKLDKRNLLNNEEKINGAKFIISCNKEEVIETEIEVDGEQGEVVDIVEDENIPDDEKLNGTSDEELIDDNNFTTEFGYDDDSIGLDQEEDEEITEKVVEIEDEIVETEEKVYYIKNYEYSFEKGTANISWTTNKDEAYRFETGKSVFYNKLTNNDDKNGLIIIDGLPEAHYYAEEVEAPAGCEKTDKIAEVDAKADKMNAFYVLDDNGNPVKDGNGNKIIPNRKLFVNISGIVWNENWDGKQNLRNNVYDDTDRVFSKFRVQLVDNREGKVIQKTTTDNDGKYRFENVNIDSLGYLYVEVVYNGVVYQTVDFGKASNGSKFNENDRSGFNNKYAIVEEADGNTVNIRDIGRNKTGNEKYTAVLGNPTNNAIAKATPSFQEIHMMDNNQNCQDRIIANTPIYDNTSYLKSEYEALVKNNGVVTEIENVNCGLYERAQTDLSLGMDLLNVKTTINDKGYRYDYNHKEDREDLKTSLGIEWGRTKNGDLVYEQPIYYADAMWDSQDDNKELQVYATYRISVSNENSYKANIYQIKDFYGKYFSDSIDFVEVYDDKGNPLSKDIRKQSIWNDFGGTLYIGSNDKPILEIPAGESRYIDVVFKLSRETINKIMEQNQEQILKNSAEICAYGTVDNNGKTYPAFDMDSCVGNTDPANVLTYEDDTCGAPDFKITFENERKVSGNVFLDSTDNTLHTNQIRQGDGVYRENDGNVKGVKVELVPVDGNGAVINNDISTTTDENGYFEIKGFIPGTYKLQYTWGNGTKCNEEEINVQNYKATIYRDKNSNDWYETETERYSDATDDWNLRQQIDSELNNIYQIYDGNNKNNTNRTNTNRTMTSTTPEMSFGIELKEINNEYVVKNIDFGIVRRARQSIELEKYIKSAKLILANKSEVVNIEVIEKDGKRQLKEPAQYVTYINNQISNEKPQLKIEVDKEIMQGSTLEVVYGIKVKNNSELDYATEAYYKYGGTNGNTNKVTLTPKMIVDFPGLDWPKNSSNGWKDTTTTNTYSYIENNGNKIIYADGDKNTVANYKTIYYENGELKTLNPGESTNEIEVGCSKVLSTGNDDKNLNNDAEIVWTSKNGGGTIESITPGNYKPGSAHELDDSQAENVYVIESTGKNLAIILPISIAVFVLSITGTGIILIKKKVLSN